MTRSHIALVAGLVAGVALIAVSAASGTPRVENALDLQAANKAPRLVDVRARIGRVYEEGRGWRQGGLQLRFDLCDDGPQNTTRRWALLNIVHRSTDATGAQRSLRERFFLLTYDIRFNRQQCVRNIDSSSLAPTEFGEFTCYSIAVKVRDPAGKWSNTVTRTVRECSPEPGTPTPPPAPTCSDGLDNDMDGAIDYPADTGCSSSLDTDETTTAYQCDDGLDNDSDGKTDFPDDIDCTGRTDTTEAAAPPPPSNCDSSYPGICIPPPPPDLDCGDVPYTNFVVLPPDPHGFDGDNDGVGCES